MSKHGGTERYIIELFENAKEFDFEDTKYKIVKIGKPRPNRGECKTDVYLLVRNVLNNETREIKISIKQNDADFLENKISLSRAVEIFGEQTKEILTRSIKSVEKSFLDDYLIYLKRYKKTEEKCIKIGWKFELINKHGKERSSEILLNNEQKIDVYSGSNLNEEKKNSKVNGEVIIDSGVANYILEVENTTQDLNYYIARLLPINNYAIEQKVYFACKAINYRAQFDKWDGNRPLAVYISWRLENGIIKAEFIMDKPLEIHANEIGYNIRNILNELKINSENFHEIRKYIDNTIVILES